MMFIFTQKASGYIDPGTTSAIYGVLAPLLSMLLVFLAFLTRPIRKFFKFLISKFRGNSGHLTDEQSLSEELSDPHKTGQDT